MKTNIKIIQYVFCLIFSLFFNMTLSNANTVVVNKTNNGAYSYAVENSGFYLFELYGAQGGSSIGGYGGYSTGVKYLATGTNLYIYVGGRGGSTASRYGASGGYNGGGAGGTGYNTYYGGSGGGGATHVATTSGLLNSLSGNKNSILVVAGGGGGVVGSGMWTTSSSYKGGNGGGTNGNVGGGLATAYATQTIGYAFGYGQSGRNGTNSSGGGEGNGGAGGGWYGGYSYAFTGNGTNSSGGGGSGYITGLSSSTVVEGVTYNASTTTSTHTGDGSCVITLISTGNYTINYFDKNGVTFSGSHGVDYSSTYSYMDGTSLVNPTKDHYSFVGWYEDQSCSSNPINSLNSQSYTNSVNLYAKWSFTQKTISDVLGNNVIIKNEANINDSLVVQPINENDDQGYTELINYASTNYQGYSHKCLNISLDQEYNTSIDITLSLGEDYAYKNLRILHYHNNQVEDLGVFTPDSGGVVTFTSENGLSDFLILNETGDGPLTGIDLSKNTYLLIISITGLLITGLYIKRHLNCK